MTKATPPVWVIGDVQGCATALDTLLAHPEIAAQPEAQLWFAGDLTNRGPDSAGTLRRIRDLGSRAVTVLGNHDLHLLAVAAGIRKPGKSDTFCDVLNAPDADELILWLRQQPLAHHLDGYLMVHAGVVPQWTVRQTLECAQEVQAALSSDDWRERLSNMYGNEPNRWRDDLGRNKRLRIIVNALTRIRMCTRKGRMDFTLKGAPVPDADLLPWFDVPKRATRGEATILFGHWSTLGLMVRPDAICLDTGCVWGRQLTALRLNDRKIIQIEAAGLVPQGLVGE